MNPDNPCVCEHADHFGAIDNADYGATDHAYAKARAETVIETSRGRFAVCYACANDHAEPDADETSEPDADAGDVIVSDARGSAEEIITQYGREVARCYPEARDATIRAFMARSQFWPNAFYVSDHGNAILISASWVEGDESDPARAVYVHGFGWRDCDTLGSVIGFDLAAVDALAEEQIRDEIERARDDDYDPDVDENDPDYEEHDPADDLADYGANTFTLGDVIRDCLPHGRDGLEKLAELMRDGIISV